MILSYVNSVVKAFYAHATSAFDQIDISLLPGFFLYICPLAAKVVLLLVLLVSFLDVPKPPQQYQVIEYFAGVGRVAAMSKHLGFDSAAVDILYGKAGFGASGKRSPMDINSDSGLVLPVCISSTCIFTCPWTPCPLKPWTFSSMYIC